MRLTAILLVVACLHAGAKSYSQKVSLSVRDQPLEKVMQRIKKLTGYSFFYNSGWLRQANGVTVTLVEAPMDQALDLIFSGQPFSYRVINHTVVLDLRRRTGADSLLSNAEAAPVIVVHGKVTDSVGTALSGASILNRRTRQIVMSDANGLFDMQAVAGDRIIVSFVGYQSSSFIAGGSGAIQLIVLKASSDKLNEVVVSTGYQVLPKERATGSFVQLDSAIINKKVSPDVIGRLEGNVPGLIFNRNSVMGNGIAATGNYNINIRGHTTINSNDQPLVVVDNFPYDGDINNINPNDVESITVLKDAAASSIWGVRSGNGVIVITTKKGKLNQALQTDFNSNVTIGNKPDLFYSPDFMRSEDYIYTEQNLFAQGYYNANITNRNHLFISPVQQMLADQRSGLISSAVLQAGLDSLRGNDVRNDISKYYYRKEFTQQYALSLKGGGSRNTYFLSAGYDKDRSSLVGNQNDRLTLNLRNTFALATNLELTAALNFSQGNSKTNSTLNDLNNSGGVNTIYPYEKLADEHGNALAIVKNYNYRWVSNPANTTGLLDWTYKPLDELKFADNTARSTDIRINTGLKYKVYKDLNLQVQYQYETATANTRNYNSIRTYYTRNLINRYTNLAGPVVYPIPMGGIVSQNQAQLNASRIRGQIDYHHTWNNRHELTALATAEFSSNVNKTNGHVAFGYDDKTGVTQNVDLVNYYPTIPGNGSAQVPNGGEDFGKMTDRYVSYLTNAAYTYNGRYTISASGRIDKSNLFGVTTNQKAVPLYSAGLAWNLSKESFYHLDWLPYAKLRTTYGYNGNVNKTASAVATIYQSTYAYFTGGNYAYIYTPGNPELRWEKDRMINFGLDFGLGKDRLSGTFDYFLKKGMNLFGTSPLPYSTGFQDFFGNTANTKGHGWELALNSRNVTSGAFSWTTNFHLSYVVDIVTKYDTKSDVVSYVGNGTGNDGNIIPAVGRSVFSMYAYRSGPLTHETGDPQGYLNGKLSTDYSSITSTTTFDSLRYFGASRPPFYGSIRNTFSYGPLSLSFNILYKLHYYFRRSYLSYYNLYRLGSGHSDFAKRWQKPGDEQFTTVPSMATLPLNTSRDDFYGLSESLVDKADHIRLQDIMLSYDLGKKDWRKLPFNHLQVYTYINNVGILWKANHSGLDPDLYGSAMPLPRTYSFGIKANF